VPARRPGVFAKAADALSDRLGRLRPPPLDWRTFSYGLLALIALILVARNWAPVRIDFFGWHPDVPKAVAFVFFFALGLLAEWLWVFRSQRIARRAAAELAEAVPEPEDEEEPEDTDDEESTL